VKWRKTHNHVCKKASFQENPCAPGKEEWSERQDLNLSTAIDYQAVTKPDTQGDSQIQVALGHDLSQVVTAWAKLPAPLKSAILAIIKSAE
jgi:hypothetical protein